MARETTPSESGASAVEKAPKKSLKTERTLVTGFGQFPGVQANPSALLAEGCGRPFHLLDVSYRGVREFLNRLDPSRFDRLLLLGVASSTLKCRIELFARNLIGTTADIHGEAPGPCEIANGAPRVLGGTLWDNTKLLDADHIADHPLLLHSFSAGTYLCNYIYFEALMRFRDKRVGFLHVPDESDMPLELQQEAVAEVLRIVEAAPLPKQ